jgi:cytochrome c peroxidase
MAKVQLNKELTDAQIDDVVAFLNGLTGEFPKIEMPRLPIYANKAFKAE